MNNKYLIALVCCTACCVPGAYGAESLQLEEVIVTAQKREQNLQDVPMAVTSISREILQDNEINNIQDLSKLVPSMRYTPADDPTNSSVRIRGVGTAVFSMAVEPNVSVVVDEVPIARTSMANFEFADLERVEVLRGPQGTLFGKNSTAGLMHVITRDPAEEFEAFSRLTLEESDDYPSELRKLQAGLSGPIGDTLGLRVTGFKKSFRGYLEDVFQEGNNLPDIDSYGVRSKLRWDASDNLVVKASVEYQKSTGESTPLTFRDASEEKRARTEEDVYGKYTTRTKTLGNNLADVKNRAASIIVDWDLGEFTLTSVTGWRGYDIDRNLSIPDLDGNRIDVVKNGGWREIETFTQELRITSRSEGALEYTLGALWFDNTIDNFFERVVEDIPSEALLAIVAPDTIPPGLDLSGTPGESYRQYAFSEGTVVTKNLGVFTQGTWHINDQWHLTAGARYIHEELTGNRSGRSFTEHNTSGVHITDSSDTAPDTTIQDTTYTGTFSIKYDWTESTNLYSTISTGYRGGAFDFANGNIADAFSNPIDPETAFSYEVGSKSRLFNNLFELNIAVFHTTFKEFQAQIVDLAGERSVSNLVPSSRFRIANAGELVTKGVEVDFKGVLSRSWFVYGSLLYNKAEFTEFITQCFVGQQPGEAGGRDENGDGNCDRQDVAGGVLPNAPEKSVTVAARYSKQLDNSRAYLQVSGRWVDDIQFSAEQHPLTIQEAYSVWDLRAGWVGFMERMEVSFYIKNLFQQRYVQGFFPLSLTNDRHDISHFLSPESDRNFGLSLGYRW